MNKLVKFENTPIDIQVIDGTPMFELYAVGMALGQIKKNSAGALYPAKDRIDKNAEKAEIKPCVRNVHKYITESQIYDLMLETRTDKCRAFRKWLTNEVLPEINKTGSYTMPKQENKQLEIYNYFDKKYKGEPVLSSMDVSHFTNINYSVVDWYARSYLNKGTDYYYLKEDELRAFKEENPQVSKLARAVVIFTQSGFDKLCKAYNIKGDTPELFIEDKHPIEPKKKKTEYCLILSNNFVQEEIERIKNYLVAVSVAIDRCNMHNIKVEEMAVRRKCLEDITRELESRVSIMVHTKLSTTTEYKF